jgi:carbonic anhydrase
VASRLLWQASPVLRGLVDDGKLKIVGATYDLESGEVSVIC